MDVGSNSLRIACTSEVINIIRSHSAPLDMYEWTWLIKHFLENPEIKEEFIKRYGTEKYTENLAHYSRTNIEIRKENELKKAIKEKKEELKLQIEKMKAEAYKQQTTTVEKKDVESRLRILKNRRKNLEYDLQRGKTITYSGESTKKELEKIISEIEALEAHLIS